MTINELVLEVSRRTAVNPRVVHGFLSVVLEVLREELVHGGQIRLRGLCTLKWRVMAPWLGLPRGQLQCIASVNLQKEWLMTKESDEGMEKYSVALDEGKTKLSSAASGTRCPICQKELLPGPRCPEHGTEPFERSKNAKKS